MKMSEGKVVAYSATDGQYVERLPWRFVFVIEQISRKN